MSCCSNGYCQLSFPIGPPLTDLPVSTVEAKYLFLPYGTLLAHGELIRIWTESGKTREVIIEHKVALDYRAQQLTPITDLPLGVYLPWQLIALDSGWDINELTAWGREGEFNPSSPPGIVDLGSTD